METPVIPTTSLWIYHEELVYILECLVKDLTGEAKSEISLLIGKIAVDVDCPAEVRKIISDGLESVLDCFRVDNYDRDARSQLITIRRQIRNTLSALEGGSSLYNYAPEFTLRSSTN